MVQASSRSTIYEGFAIEGEAFHSYSELPSAEPVTSCKCSYWDPKARLGGASR